MTKQLFTCGISILLLVQCKKQDNPPAQQQSCVNSEQVSNDFLAANTLKEIIDNYTDNGLPGISFIAKKGNRYWQHNSGRANTERNIDMAACMLWPAYSISKMYTATCILKLKEEGKLSLDQKINTCLPAGILAKVPAADIISIRMLLNHSSGIENFWENPAFVSSYIDDPQQVFTTDDYLEAAQARLFEPGTDVAYSNTNYLLLACIIDHVTQQDHSKAFAKYIWQPLFQSGNYYRNLPVAQQSNMPQLYADIDLSGTLINYTALSLLQFSNESGSNSIMSTPKNYVDFMDAVAHNKLLSATTAAEMKTWFSGSGNDGYGLGLELFEYNGKQLFGHSGSSFGGRTLLLYDPQTGVSFFLGVNAGDELGGPVLEKISQLMNEVLAAMAA